MCIMLQVWKRQLISECGLIFNNYFVKMMGPNKLIKLKLNLSLVWLCALQFLLNKFFLSFKTLNFLLQAEYLFLVSFRCLRDLFCFNIWRCKLLNYIHHQWVATGWLSPNLIIKEKVVERFSNFIYQTAVAVTDSDVLIMIWWSFWLQEVICLLSVIN